MAIKPENYCSHKRTVSREVAAGTFTLNNPHYDLDYTVGAQLVAQTEEVSLCEDIDLHRYRCAECGEVGYYSKAARDFFELGIKSPGVIGLE